MSSTKKPWLPAVSERNKGHFLAGKFWGRRRPYRPPDRAAACLAGAGVCRWLFSGFGLQFSLMLLDVAGRRLENDLTSCAGPHLANSSKVGRHSTIPWFRAGLHRNGQKRGWFAQNPLYTWRSRSPDRGAPVHQLASSDPGCDGRGTPGIAYSPTHKDLGSD